MRRSATPCEARSARFNPSRAGIPPSCSAKGAAAVSRPCPSRVTLRKLIQMNQARVLGDLAVPPGNRLEALRGNLSGLHSIRINDQWRIWTDEGPAQAAIVDYH